MWPVGHTQFADPWARLLNTSQNGMKETSWFLASHPLLRPKDSRPVQNRGRGEGRGGGEGGRNAIS